MLVMGIPQRPANQGKAYSKNHTGASYPRNQRSKSIRDSWSEEYSSKTLGQRNIKEPTAYALSYDMNNKEGLIPIFDLGNGTFDVLIVEISNGVFEDISPIETCDNSLQLQSVNDKSLIEELDMLLERLHVPSEYATCLTGSSFGEEACD
ncbi:hypothetical protein KIW84_043180 [Lathyrus oleraceus]|uniref:Uncharacterized protein n=1 Tax=Pisum sativum TaxID=3888 RepID=A0A9D5ARG5_PEA|nr:hypothetical protein KIW84_043180 [Pisum sativum]